MSNSELIALITLLIALIVGVSTLYVNHIRKNSDKEKSIKKSFNWNFFSKIDVKQ